jgi:mono/diheme cytochrome c family protein
MRRSRKVLVAVVMLAVVGAGAFAWLALGPGPMDFAGGRRVALAAYTGATLTGVPSGMTGGDLITRGEYLTRAADCTGCHTAKGGQAFVGGLAFKLPFGTLYSPNITPDPQTGIGAWSNADFIRAMHHGIAKDGTHLYPAFPYAAYAMMPDDDVLAIKAYLFSLKPVQYTAPANTLVFPFNQRWLMAIWSLLYNPERRFQPNLDRSAEWNRGAYLVEAMAHCGDCHTPRNLLQALDNKKKFAGAVAAGWRAYNITADAPSGVGGWSDDELARYLSAGHADGRGTASGPMGEAVDLSLSHLTQGDIRAMVSYLRTIPSLATPDLPATATTPAPVAPKQGIAANADPRGKQVFEGACASCHDWTGAGALTAYATLTGARAVNDASGVNLAQIVLGGTHRRTPTGEVFMPAFGASYSDAEIAAVANYVTARFGAKPSGVTARDVAEMRKQN